MAHHDGCSAKFLISSEWKVRLACGLSVPVGYTGSGISLLLYLISGSQKCCPEMYEHQKSTEAVVPPQKIEFQRRNSHAKWVQKPVTSRFITPLVGMK